MYEHVPEHDHPHDPEHLLENNSACCIWNAYDLPPNNMLVIPLQGYFIFQAQNS